MKYGKSLKFIKQNLTMNLFMVLMTNTYKQK